MTDVSVIVEQTDVTVNAGSPTTVSVASNQTIVDVVPIGAQGPKGDPGGSAMAVGLALQLSTLNIPVGTDIIQTSGYSQVGIGAARYYYTTAAGSAPTTLTCANGRRYALAEPVVTPYMTGGAGNNTGDDAGAIAAADAYAAAAGLRLMLPAGHWRIGSNLTLNAPVVEFAGGATIVWANNSALLTISNQLIAPLWSPIFQAPEIVSGCLIKFLSRLVVSAENFGAAGTGDPSATADDSRAMQQAIEALSAGGVVIGRPGAVYPTRFPVCVLGQGVHLDFAHSEIWTDMGRTGRTYTSWAVQIGNSREANLQQIKTNRLAGDFASALENASFVDVPYKTYPDQTGFTPTAQRCRVDLFRCAFFDDVVSPSTYGIQVSNAYDCHWELQRCRNAGQAWGHGSDVSPRTPYAFKCTGRLGIVEQPNQTHTFYADGFHGYARDCWVDGGVIKVGVPTGTTDGNGYATSGAMDCWRTNVNIDCGFGANGAVIGFGHDNIRGGVRNIRGKNAVALISDYHDPAAASTDGPEAHDCYGNNVTYLIQTSTKYARYVRITGTSVNTAEINLTNINATNNLFDQCDADRIVYPTGSWTEDQALAFQVFPTGPRRKGVQTRTYPFLPYVYPIHASTISPFQSNIDSGSNTYTNSTKLLAASSTGIATTRFHFPLTQLGWSLITNLKIYLTFETGSLTAGSTVIVRLMRRGNSPNDGNINDANTVVQSWTIAANTDSTEDYVFNSGVTCTTWPDGAQGEVWLEVDVKSATANTDVKSLSIQGYRF